MNNADLICIVLIVSALIAAVLAVFKRKGKCCGKCDCGCCEKCDFSHNDKSKS